MPMGVFSVDGPEMPTVESVEEMVGRFTSELITHIPVWKQKLGDAPEALEPLEREVHAAFARGADLLVVGLLAVVMKEARFEQQVERMRRGYSQPLQRGRARTVRVRLATVLFAGFFGVGIFNMWVDEAPTWRSTLFVTGLAIVFTAALSWWIGRGSRTGSEDL